MESPKAEMRDLIDPKLELIVMLIKNTEFDCCMWQDSTQRELATEILEGIEARYKLEMK